MNTNITRMIGSNGEVITILPITISYDRSNGSYYAYDGSTGCKYSISELERLANDGDPSAQCAMGDYYNTEERHADFHKAFGWYKKAANQNHAQALWNLGNFYAPGTEEVEKELFGKVLGVVEKDFNKAVALYEESAAHGFVDAMFHLGGLYSMSGMFDRAVDWLEKADGFGHPEAKMFLEAARMLSKFNSEKGSCDSN